MPLPGPVLLGLLVVGGLVLAGGGGGGDEAVRGPGPRARGRRGHAVPPLPAGWWTPSSRFGWRTDPVTGKRKHHDGLDLPAPAGTPVFAPVDGVVERLDRAGVGKGVINGNAVFLDAAGTRWAFLHLSTITVTPGQRLVAGQVLGKVGATGRSRGNHLHLQVYDDRTGRVIDPESQFAPGAFGTQAVA